MMISTKGRYALTTLIDIAQNFDGVTPVSIKEISDRQKISMKYLEQIISLMVKGGFLKSIRRRHPRPGRLRERHEHLREIRQLPDLPPL